MERWKHLDPRVRQAIVAAGAFEAGLKTAALIDLALRPPGRAGEHRGRWALAIVAVNSVGVLPIVSLVRGRR